jgi:hypothetical protein
MKIDINVKLYLDGNNEAKTEEELKAEIKEWVDNEMTALQGGDFYDYNREFDAFMNKEDIDYRHLINCIFDEKLRTGLIEEYRNHLTEIFTDSAYDEHIEVVKKIQVEI